MKQINFYLLVQFMQCRKLNGMPTVNEIIKAINRTDTKTITPPNWRWI
jgi:hypothetical protein